MRSQLLAARLALAAFVLAILACAAAIACVRLRLLGYDPGLTVMAGAVALGLTAFLCALAWLFMALKRNEGTGRRIGLTALIGSVALLWMPLHNVAHGLASPPIHDAASDPDDPPPFVALAKRRAPGANDPRWDGEKQIRFKDETNTVAYMLHTYYGTNSPQPITKPHAMLQMTQARLFWHAFETAKKMGWAIVDYNAAQGRIEATDTSFWFGQTSDIVIRVQAAGAIGARLDVRSQSEVSATDFGDNITRIKQFYDRFRGNF